MTNKELAASVAEQIILLRTDRASMVSLLDEGFLNWRSALKKFEPLVPGPDDIVGKHVLLQRLDDSPDDCNELLSIIYRYMLTGWPDEEVEIA